MIIQTKPEPYCPECGGRMKLRKPKDMKGAPEFDPFWGCSNYPDCKGKRNILPDGKPDMEELDVDELPPAFDSWDEKYDRGSWHPGHPSNYGDR